MLRRFGTIWLTLCLLLSFAAGAGVSAEPTFRMVCRMSGVEMPLPSRSETPSGCCAVKAPHIALVAFSTAGCCDLKAQPGQDRSVLIEPVAVPDLGPLWLPTPAALRVAPVEAEPVRAFYIADLTGPRPPPASSHGCRAPPFVSC